VRKVTYSLPATLVAELDRRTVETAKSKSAVVADALALYFAERDREALAQIYAEAARDPAFRADNEAVLRDFAALDAEAELPPISLARPVPSAAHRLRPSAVAVEAPTRER
jgi:hypothetical protein